jgi:hypothetical protein
MKFPKEIPPLLKPRRVYKHFLTGCDWHHMYLPQVLSCPLTMPSVRMDRYTSSVILSPLGMRGSWYDRALTAQGTRVDGDICGHTCLLHFNNFRIISGCLSSDGAHVSSCVWQYVVHCAPDAMQWWEKVSQIFYDDTKLEFLISEAVTGMIHSWIWHANWCPCLSSRPMESSESRREEGIQEGFFNESLPSSSVKETRQPSWPWRDTEL